MRACVRVRSILSKHDSSEPGGPSSRPSPLPGCRCSAAASLLLSFLHLSLQPRLLLLPTLLSLPLFAAPFSLPPPSLSLSLRCSRHHRLLRPLPEKNSDPHWMNICPIYLYLYFHQSIYSPLTRTIHACFICTPTYAHIVQQPSINSHLSISKFQSCLSFCPFIYQSIQPLTHPFTHLSIYPASTAFPPLLFTPHAPFISSPFSCRLTAL